MRRSGRTTEQMLAAPRGATFVWPLARSLTYAVSLAFNLGRRDLQIVTIEFLESGLRGFGGEVVLDHETLNRMNSRQAQLYDEWRSCLPQRPKLPREASQKPTDLVELLRSAPTPQAALDALDEARRGLGRDRALHIRFYRGDLVADLVEYLQHAFSGELARRKVERDAAARREHADRVERLLRTANGGDQPGEIDPASAEA